MIQHLKQHNLGRTMTRFQENEDSVFITTRGFKSLHWVAFLNIRRTLDFRIHLSNWDHPGLQVKKRIFLAFIILGDRDITISLRLKL